jgi:hypothetical protein
MGDTMKLLSGRLQDVFSYISDDHDAANIVSIFRVAHSYTVYDYSDNKYPLTVGAYLDYDGKMLSYLPTGKESGPDGFSASGRVSGRPGRVARKFLTAWGVRFEDSDLEAFVNAIFCAYQLINGTADDAVQFEIVSGDDIAAVYNGNYGGMAMIAGPESCMTNMGDYMGLYTENPRSIRMAIATYQDSIVARALLWRLNDGDTWMMDNRYSSADKMGHLLRDWGKEQGFVFGSNRSDYVRVGAYDYEHYPYVDSFRYFDMHAGRLYSYKAEGVTHELADTSGDASQTWLHECETCYASGSESDFTYAYGVGYLCHECHSAGTCTYCDEYVGENQLSDGLCNVCESDHTCINCNERQDDYLGGEYCEECLEEEARLLVAADSEGTFEGYIPPNNQAALPDFAALLSQ